MEPAPSAHIVGKEFVKQYYTMLNAAPEHLHRFYSNNSNFVHGGMDGRPDEHQAVTGQAEIHKKIMSLNFNHCHARICQVDCQSSVGGSVVIQVIGELSNNGQPMRKFVQSFVLAPQAAKKYYVHIDIFRYQDICPPTTESDAQPDEQYAEELEVTEAAVDQPVTDDVQQNMEQLVMEQPPAQDATTATTAAAAAAADGTNGELSDDVTCVPPAQQSDSAVPVMAAEEQLGEDVKPPAVDSTAEDEVTTVDSAADDGAAEQLDGQEQMTEPETAAQPEVPVKPLTWAAMASRNAGGPSTPTTSANTSSTMRPQTVPDTKSDAGLQQSKTISMNGGRVMVNGGNKDDMMSRRSTGSTSTPVSASAINYPDNQQVFVGNLPQHLTDQDLIDFFEQYGKVLEFRINKKPGGPQAGNNLGQKNFGFMAFDSPDTVQKVLSERPIYLRKHRLNIEEKKPREELAATRQSSARGAGSASRRGGYGRVDVRNSSADEARTY